MPAAMVIPAPLVYIKVVAVSSLWVSPPARKEWRHTFPDRQCYFLQARKKWVSLVPAATVIPALLAYIKVVAVKSS